MSQIYCIKHTLHDHSENTHPQLDTTVGTVAGWMGELLIDPGWQVEKALVFDLLGILHLVTMLHLSAMQHGSISE